MNQKTKAILVIGSIIGYMICSNYVFYQLGRNVPQPLEGYRLRGYEENTTVWATIPIMDSFSIQGDPIHPARLKIDINTTYADALFFEVLTDSGISLYSISETSIVAYEQEITSPQTIFINWMFTRTDCGMFCPIRMNIAIWEWIVLEPVAMEGVA